jgi:hypothetical protein
MGSIYEQAAQIKLSDAACVADEGLGDGGLLRVVDAALQPDKVPAEIIRPSTRPTATANIVGMTNSRQFLFGSSRELALTYPCEAVTTFA